MRMNETVRNEEFVLQEPVLVCRWRLAGGTLPLLGRHIKALAARTIQGKPITPELVGWAKQHIEWTLNPTTKEEKDGVLLLVVDKEGKAAMSIGPFQGLDELAKHLLREEIEGLEPCALQEDSGKWQTLIARARLAQKEAKRTNVAPEILWAVESRAQEDGTTKCETGTPKTPHLIAGVAPDSSLSGANSLICDLVKTKGYRLDFDEELLDKIVQERSVSPEGKKKESQKPRYTEAFLVSDELGVVGDSTQPFTKEFGTYYQTLLTKASEQCSCEGS